MGKAIEIGHRDTMVMHVSLRLVPVMAQLMERRLDLPWLHLQIFWDETSTLHPPHPNCYWSCCQRSSSEILTNYQASVYKFNSICKLRIWGPVNNTGSHCLLFVGSRGWAIWTYLILLLFTYIAFLFFTNWRPSTRKMIDLLYCGGLESNLQYLQGRLCMIPLQQPGGIPLWCCTRY